MLSDDGRVAQSPIKDGIYSIVDAPVGHVVVAINGGDPVPPLPPATRPEQYAEMKKKELEKLKKDLAEGKIKELPKEPLIVPLQYDDTKRSGLGFEVKPGKQTHNFDLPRLPEEEKEKPK